MKVVAAQSKSGSEPAKIQQKAEGRPDSLAPRGVLTASVFDGSVIQRKSSCACGGTCPRCQSKSKLTIGAPDDTYEQEANRVADQVMRMPKATLYRAATTAAHDGEGEGRTHFKAVGAASVSSHTAAHLFLHNLGPGQPLKVATRSFFEPRFGHDLSRVRVHTDRRAAESAHSILAKAYTLGHDVVFGHGQYQAETSQGQRLLAHELAHVMQQSGGGGRLALSAAGPRAARAPVDLGRLDRELREGTVTQSSGEIGAAALGCARGQSRAACRNQANPPEDSSLPIELEVYPRNTPEQASGPPAQNQSPTGPAPATDASEPSDDDDVRDAGAPIPAGVPEPEPQPAPLPAPPTTPRQARPRALVVGGIHGDERGALDIMARLLTEFRSATNPLQRDFDTLVIPFMNPGGVADRTRNNRRGVDLNRNFPGLGGFPAPSGTVLPRQPEVQAVINVVQTMHPARILALHAIGSAGSTSSASGGVFADPVEGDARELACRMALRIRGGSRGSGGATTDVNTRGNRLANDLCNSRYPQASAVSVTTAQSSLGAWASAPPSLGGQGTTVITHETAGKAALAATGPRSVDTIMPGIRDFLLDNGSAASEADALLRSAVSDAFLTGEGTTPADRAMLEAAKRVVLYRFNDMAAHFAAVWAPNQIRLNPIVRFQIARLTMASHHRSFSGQSRIMADQLRGLSRTSTDPEIERAILTAMQTRSMPGFSRHHWGTEIDVNDATRSRWEGTGDLVSVISFLRDEAPRFGFFHPYTSTPPDPAQRHYQDEPWHISYWPLANVFAQQWGARITGTVLNQLIVRTADAVRGPVPRDTMLRVLQTIRLQEFQSNVASPP